MSPTAAVVPAERVTDAGRGPTAAELTKPQRDAMSEVAEPRAEFSAIRLLVERRDDDALSSEVLGVVQNKGERPLLVDARGEVYREGMDDFRRNNEIFGTDDEFAYNRNWEDESAKLDLVTVSAKVEPDRTPWYLAGGAAAVLAVGGLLLWRLRARRKLEAHFDALRREGPDPGPAGRNPADRQSEPQSDRPGEHNDRAAGNGELHDRAAGDGDGSDGPHERDHRDETGPPAGPSGAEGRPRPDGTDGNGPDPGGR
ncbi:hypothetical protein MTQ01_08980 [Streptomyces sp. XM4193]|uniref:hypothetical protein n=1 Tax=Streptomyces sp. XM4193 TaxID=2929782 RepID=UPI001FF8C1F7|nr:hypothetical protein [Streptomyces sp. XM4193]MCK1796136.1 hypothetical protein [Streptomyces sp. XM4193]